MRHTLIATLTMLAVVAPGAHAATIAVTTADDSDRFEFSPAK